MSVKNRHSPDKSPESPDPSVEARRFPDKRVSALAARPAERRMIGRRPAAHRSALVTFSANIALFPDNPSRNSDLSAKPPHFTDKLSSHGTLSVKTLILRIKL